MAIFFQQHSQQDRPRIPPYQILREVNNPRMQAISPQRYSQRFLAHYLHDRKNPWIPRLPLAPQFLDSRAIVFLTKSRLEQIPEIFLIRKALQSVKGRNDR